MKVDIIRQEEQEVRVTIACNHVDETIFRLKRHIESFHKRIRGRKENQIVFVEASEILYFEAVDNRSFLYTSDEVLEVEEKLYELEYLFSEEDFIRSSKSQIINIRKIVSLKPELNRTIQATMCNGERLSISRKYAVILKRRLGIGGRAK